MSLEQRNARLPGGYWMLASTCGFLIGAVLAVVEAWVTGVLEALFMTDETSFLLVVGLVWASAGVSVGIGIGVGQCLVLRRRIQGAGWWILASVLGFGLGNGIGAVLPLYVGRFLPIDCLVAFCPMSTVTMWLWVSGGAACGLILGSVQWLVLRRSVRCAGWWIPANIVSWAAAAVLGEFAGEVMFSTPLHALPTSLEDLVGRWWLAPSYLVLTIYSWEGLLVASVLASAITGLVLAWFLKHPVHNRRWESV